MNISAVRFPRLLNVRRQSRFERLIEVDRLSTPSDLALRPFLSVKGLHR